jgi:hypothetical protein
MRATPLVLLAALLAGCAGGARGASVVAPLVTDPDVEATVSAVVETAVADDARGAADSLYAPGALVVSDGATRGAAPRLAAMLAGGEAAVASSQVSVREGFAWALVEYRWVNPSANAVRVGRATLLLAPRRDGAGWWIIHAHSSSVR